MALPETQVIYLCAPAAERAAGLQACTCSRAQVRSTLGAQPQACTPRSGAPLLAPARRGCLGAPEGRCRAQGCSTRQGWKRLACRKTTSGARCAREAGLVSALGTVGGVASPTRTAKTLVECCSCRAGCQQEQGVQRWRCVCWRKWLYLAKGGKCLVPAGAGTLTSCLSCASKGGRLAGRRGAGRSHPRNSRPSHHLGVVESRLTRMRARRDCSWDRHYPGDVGYLEGDTAPGARGPPSCSAVCDLAAAIWLCSLCCPACCLHTSRGLATTLACA